MAVLLRLRRSCRAWASAWLLLAWLVLPAWDCDLLVGAPQLCDALALRRPLALLLERTDAAGVAAARDALDREPAPGR
eukprot:4746876-Alexandrium_andersonii.AAC.1